MHIVCVYIDAFGQKRGVIAGRRVELSGSRRCQDQAGRPIFAGPDSGVCAD